MIRVIERVRDVGSPDSGLVHATSPDCRKIVAQGVRDGVRGPMRRVPGSREDTLSTKGKRRTSQAYDVQVYEQGNRGTIEMGRIWILLAKRCQAKASWLTLARSYR